MRKIVLFDSFDAISEDSIVSRIRSALRPSTRAVLGPFEQWAKTASSAYRESD